MSGRVKAGADAWHVKVDAELWVWWLGTSALSLDGDKRPCNVLASNAGHCLFSGTASPDHAARVAELMVSKRFNSGWGVRTVAVGEARYNPMSYHTGSTWPHDHALTPPARPAAAAHLAPAPRSHTTRRW